MSFLLDTNVFVDALRGRGHAGVLLKSRYAPERAVTCAVVELELRYGALRTSDPATHLRDVEDIILPFHSLPFDDHSAAHAAEIRAHLAALGTPIGPYDLLIAAIARASGATLVTANAAEFARVPDLRVEDWRAVAPT